MYHGFLGRNEYNYFFCIVYFKVEIISIVIVLFSYLMIIFGALITFLIQSSSILTATITPLVGEGFLTLEKAYPITLGANIGTVWE